MDTFGLTRIINKTLYDKMVYHCYTGWETWLMFIQFKEFQNWKSDAYQQYVSNTFLMVRVIKQLLKVWFHNCKA